MAAKKTGKYLHVLTAAYLNGAGCVVRLCGVRGAPVRGAGCGVRGTGVDHGPLLA